MKNLSAFASTGGLNIVVDEKKVPYGTNVSYNVIQKLAVISGSTCRCVRASFERSFSTNHRRNEAIIL